MVDPAGFGPAINRFLDTLQDAYEPGALTGLSYGSTALFSYYSCFIPDLNIYVIAFWKFFVILTEPKSQDLKSF